MSEKRKEIYDLLSFLCPFAFFRTITDTIIKNLPDTYDEAVKHYINSRIERLKFVEEIIDTRVKKLEEIKTSKESMKKEKVDIE